MIKALKDFNDDDFRHNDVKIKIIVGENESYWTNVNKEELREDLMDKIY